MVPAQHTNRCSGPTRQLIWEHQANELLAGMWLEKYGSDSRVSEIRGSRRSESV
jgi:hypothetical protein